MKTTFKIIIFATCVLAVLFFFLLLSNLPKQKLSISKVCFKENCFKVEVAGTPQQKEQGLMFREHLDKDAGMLFIFEKEENYPFWMKNTLIPLDIIWINQNQEVVAIKENAEPCQREECPIIDPSAYAKYVLEINGGLAEEIGLEVGDKVTLPY